MKEKDFDRLLGLIYESALDPGLWGETMSDLAHQVGADTFHLLGWDSGKQEITLGVISDHAWHDALVLYNSYCSAVNSHNEQAAQADPGVVIACQQHFDGRLVFGNASPQDTRPRQVMRHVMGGRLARTDTTDIVLGLMREAERGHYSPAEEAYLGRLMPHFNRALRLMDHAQTATQSGQMAAAAQDAASLAVIAANKSGQLLYCNRNGEALLKAAQVLRISHGIVSCAADAQKNGFASAFGVVVKTGRPVNLLLSSSINPDERYSATLTPLPKRGAFSLTGELEGVLCLVVPLDHRRMATAGQLMQLFDLSAAEARLARALAAGDTLECYAAGNDLKLPTIKSQLRAVFEKTGADRQAALVRLIAGIPAVREPD